MAIQIKIETCVGCGLCLKACPYDAIDIIDRKAILNDKCVHCGACVESCKFDAIISTTGPKAQIDLTAFTGILVFAEVQGDKPAKVAVELLGEGRKLADQRKTTLAAALIGNNVKQLAQDLIEHGADTVYLIEDEELGSYRTRPFAKALTAIIREMKPETVLIGATCAGRDLAPRVSNRLRTGLTADCTSLEIEDDTGLLLQTRPAFGGNIMATIICPNHRPQMATVRPGVMKPIEKIPGRQGEIITVKVDLPTQDLTVTVREIVRAAKKTVDISEAEIIVSGGRGVGSSEAFAKLKDLANSLGGQVGASRAAVESGWIDHDHQVGQTGKSVSPKLYIACGISGAIQHLAGISGSDFVVAINRDINAPIMKMADAAIVGDLHQVVPVMVKQLKEAMEGDTA